MKFNPTLPLAVALSVGVAGAVMAQTATTQTPTTSPSQPAMNYSQPQASAGQTQTGYGQTPSSTGQTQASTLQQPSATGQTPAATGQTPAAAGRMPATTAQKQAAPTTAAPAMASGTATNGNEQVRMAQQRLRAAGLYNGPQDGIMDPDTRAAIARYQQQQGLRRTESLDASTLASLERGQTTGSGSTTPAASQPSGTSGTALNPNAGALGGNAGKAFAR